MVILGENGRPNEWCNHSRLKVLIRQEIYMARDNTDVVATMSAAISSVVASLLPGVVSSVAVVVTCIS